MSYGIRGQVSPPPHSCPEGGTLDGVVHLSNLLVFIFFTIILCIFSENHNSIVYHSKHPKIINIAFVTTIFFEG